MSIQEIEAEVLKLQPEEQIRLLHTLALALEENEPALTGEELENRWSEFLADTSTAIPASELHAWARSQYGLS